LLVAEELLPSLADPLQVVDEDVGVEEGAQASPLPAEAALVGESVDPTSPPKAEDPLGVPGSMLLRVFRHRPTHRLGPRDLFAPAHQGEGSEVGFVEIDDRSHAVII
jgi:hypothetical protein